MLPTEKMSHWLKGHLKKGAGKVALEPESRNRCEYFTMARKFSRFIPVSG